MRRRAVLSACASLLVLAGCGGSPPADDVPQLSRLLDKVDSALVDRDHREARVQLRSLIRVTTEARKSGDLEADEAADIIAAAAALLTELPEPRPTPPTPTPDSSGEGPQDEENKDDGKDDEKKEKGRGEEKDEAKPDESEGHGNGHSSDNGPDDGHGN